MSLVLPRECSPELELLLAASRPAPTEAEVERLRQATQRHLDAACFLELAQVHGLVPLASQTLGRHAADLLSDALVQPLKAEAASQAVWSLRLTAELLRLFRLLDTASIPALAYKGPVLAQALYGDVTLRQVRDLDLLIRPRDRQRALALLAEDGYVVDMSEERQARRAGREFHVQLAHPGRRCLLELHWALQPEPWPLALPFEQLWDRSRTVPILDGSARTFAPEDQLLVLAVHGSKHAFCSLLWVVDVALQIDALDEHSAGAWSARLRRAGSLGCRRMLLLASRLASELLGAPVPDVVLEESRRDGTCDRLALAITSSLAGSAAAPEGEELLLQLRERARDRWRFALHRVTRIVALGLRPGPREREWIDLPRPLHFLYVFLRPLRAIATRRWRPLGELARELHRVLGALRRAQPPSRRRIRDTPPSRPR